MGSVAASRLACLVVPLFPLAARLRSEPELVNDAVVILEGSGNAARVVAATRPARRAGVRPGSTLAQARALVPRLVTRARDTECEKAAREALLEAAEMLSPRVEEAEDGVAFLDVGGLARYVRSLDESTVGRALLVAAGKAGLPARAGIAASKLAARVAAGLPDTPTVVPPGGEAEFLAPLAIDRLASELPAALAAAAPVSATRRATAASAAGEIFETLSRWGLSTIGDLARLSPADVASRLGNVGHALHQLARGKDPRPLVPRQPPPDFGEGMDLEWPLVTLEPFLAISERTLERLTSRLATQGLGCLRLEVALRLDPEGHDARALPLPAPTRDVKTLLTLLRLNLEARPPGAAVTGFRFTAHPDRPRHGQLTLFGPAEISPDRLATVLARLFALLGDGRLGAPKTVDGHLPERFALAPFAPPPAPLVRREPRLGRGLLVLRVIRPPVELEIEEREGRPVHARSAHVPIRTSTAESPPGSADRTPRAGPQVNGAVRVASGPWRLEEGWWSEAPAAREYWDVELAGGGLYRVYRTPEERWYLDGVYD